VSGDRLPDRFPVGTRYVIEGRPGSKGHLRVHSRYLEYPDGRRLELALNVERSRHGRRRAGESASRSQ
jgi:hypothetical protein